MKFHTGEKGFNCVYCAERYELKKELTQHMISVHKEEAWNLQVENHTRNSTIRPYTGLLHVHGILEVTMDLWISPNLRLSNLYSGPLIISQSNFAFDLNNQFNENDEVNILHFVVKILFKQRQICLSIACSNNQWNLKKNQTDEQNAFSVIINNFQKNLNISLRLLHTCIKCSIILEIHT